MRHQLIRSAFRAVLAAGLIASCQNATLLSSWKECLHPVGGTCFVHDLQWDKNHSPFRMPLAAKSVTVAEHDIVSVDTQETDLCIAAAKEFELRMHIDAIMASIGIRTKQFADVSTNLLFNFSRSRNALVSSIENGPVELVQWINIHDALPVAVAQSAEENNFEDDWDCGQRCKDVQGFISRPLPLRDGPNIFVFSLESETKSTESVLCQSEADFCHEVIVMDTIAKDVSPFGPIWQVGMDPDYTDVTESNPACRWSDSYTHPSICCPVELAAEAFAVAACTLPSVTAGIRPPTLVAEYDDHETAIAADSIDEPTNSPTSSAEAKPIGKLVLPLSFSHRIAIDFAMNAFSSPVLDSRVKLSKRLANPIRSLGQFLLDFAGKLDLQIEQVEMARRDTNQR